MYIKVNRFLLSHQYLDLKKVPGFFQLFYSFEFEVMQGCSLRYPLILQRMVEKRHTNATESVIPWVIH